MSTGTITINGAILTGVPLKKGVTFSTGMRVKLAPDTTTGRLVADVATVDGTGDFNWVGWVDYPGAVVGKGDTVSTFSGDYQPATVFLRQINRSFPVVMKSAFKVGDLVYLGSNGGHTTVVPTPADDHTVNDYLVGVVIHGQCDTVPAAGTYPMATIAPYINGVYVM